MSMESLNKPTVVPADTVSEAPPVPETKLLPEVAREHIRQLFFDNGNPRQEKELRQALQRVLGHLQNNLGQLDTVSREVINPHLEKMGTWLEAYSQAQLKKDVKTLGRLAPKLIEVQEQFLKELCYTIGYTPEQVVEIAAGTSAPATEAAPQPASESQPVVPEQAPPSTWNEMVAREWEAVGGKPAPEGAASAAAVQVKPDQGPQATTFAEEEHQAVSSYFYDPSQEEDERAHQKSQAAVRVPVRSAAGDVAPKPEPATVEPKDENIEAGSLVEKAGRSDSPEATEKTINVLQQQADKLIALTREYRESKGLSHKDALEEVDKYQEIRKAIQEIKRNLRNIEKGGDETAKRIRISELRNQLAGYMWDVRSELQPHLAETNRKIEAKRSRDEAKKVKATKDPEVKPDDSIATEKKTGWWDKDFQAAHGVNVRSGEAVAVPAPEGGASGEHLSADTDSTDKEASATVAETGPALKLLGLSLPPPDAAPFGLRAFRDALKIEWQPIQAAAKTRPDDASLRELQKKFQRLFRILETVPDDGLSSAEYDEVAQLVKVLDFPDRIVGTNLTSESLDEDSTPQSPAGDEAVVSPEGDLLAAIDALLGSLENATPRNTFIDGGPRQSVEVTLELASLRASLKDLKNRADDAGRLDETERSALNREFADLSYRARKLILTAERVRPMQFYGVPIPVPGPEGIPAARALQAKLVEVRARAEGQGDVTAASILREMWGHIALIPPDGLSSEQVLKLRNLGPKVPESFRSPVEGVIAARSRSMPELPGLKSKEGSEQKDKKGRGRLGFFGAAIIGGVLAALVADRQLDTDVAVAPPAAGPVAEGTLPDAAPATGPKIELVDSYWPTAAAEASADNLFPEAGEVEPKLNTEYRFTGERNAAGEVVDTISEAAFEFWKQHPEVIEGPTLTKNEFLKALYSVLDYAEKHPREKAELIDAMGLVSGNFDQVAEFDGSNEAASTVDLAPLFAKIKAEVS